MKKTIELILILSLLGSCNKKSEGISAQDSEVREAVDKIQASGVDSLKESYTGEKFILGFWNGMTKYQYDELFSHEESKRNIQEGNYVFKFENKLRLSVPLFLFEDGDGLLSYKLAINPEFEDDKLLGIKLAKDPISILFPERNKEIVNCRTQETLNDIASKSNQRLTEEDLEILRSEKERNEQIEKIEKHCIEQVINLYKEKYGKPEVKKGEYNDIYKKEPVILEWLTNNKPSFKKNVIIIEYYESKKDKSLQYIRYVDYDHYIKEHEKNSIEKKNKLNKAANEI